MSHFKFKCPRCNQIVEAPEETLGQVVNCPSCQGQITLPKLTPHPQVVRGAPPPVRAPRQNQAAATLKLGPKGVGGWLVFFCVGLTILSPLASLGQIALSWEQSKPAFDMYPSIRTAITFENLGMVAILVYGFVVGCMIWSGNRNGRTLARRYLLIRLFGFFGVEIVVMLIMSGLSSEIMAAVIGVVVGAQFRELVYFLVWWFYFKKSKRVSNTYGK